MYSRLALLTGRRLAAIAAVAVFAIPASAHADDTRIDDPMRPYVRGEAVGAEGTASRDIVLTAVLISPSRRIAVINGQLRREGDEVAGARIVRIDARSVVLSRDGEELVVTLKTERSRESTNDGDPSQ